MTDDTPTPRVSHSIQQWPVMVEAAQETAARARKLAARAARIARESDALRDAFAAWEHADPGGVKETTTTTGTGALTLAGAATGFRPFSAIATNGDTVPYCVAAGSEWEVGIGTWSTGGTLARTTVLASSNAGALVQPVSLEVAA